MNIQISQALLSHRLTGPKKLYHCAKKSYIYPNVLDEFCRTFPEAPKRLGTLPFDWLKGISKVQIPLITQRIDEVFQEFSTNIAEFTQPWGHNIVTMDKFNPHIKKLTKQMKEILGRDDISINYAGCGRQKHCHKIQVGDYSYALSSFISPKILEEGFDEYYSNSGRGFEAQGVFARYKRGSQGRFARPFMSRISAESDQSGGYILSKFIEKTHDTKSEIGTWQELRQPFIDTDTNIDNSINGIVIDMGQSEENIEYISNPQLRADWSTLSRVMDSCQNVYLDPADKREVIRFLSVARNHEIDICEKGFVKSLNGFSNAQIKFAKQLIDRAKTLRRLWENMENENRFAQVQKLMEEDFKTLYNPERYRTISLVNLNRYEYSEFYLHNFLVEEFGIEPIIK